MSRKTLYPRKTAVQVLTRVLGEHQPLDEVLESCAGSISAVAIGWMYEVCSGTLRWKGRLDFLLDSVAVRKKPSGWLRKILLLACYQLIAQDRTHAGVIVSETVSEIKAVEGEAPARFANACLRKIADQALQWRGQPFRQEFSSKEGSQWASLPEWLWIRIVQQQGAEWASAFAQACLERPTLWIRTRDEAINLEWATKGLVPGSWEVLEGGSIAHREEFQQGKLFVQDLSSQLLISEICSRVKESFEGKPISALDLCAAPGGKAVGMAWNGMEVTATDRMEQRLPLLKETVSRVAPEIRVISWEEVDSMGPYNLTWVDAPCSGTGILRRHPDVRWLRQEKEIRELIEIQRKLLETAWEKVPIGGFLVYSVCSILKEEGPAALEALGLQEFVIKSWFLCPHLSPYGDGFWAALLFKKSS